MKPVRHVSATTPDRSMIAAMPIAAHMTEGRRVLIVDDNRDAAAMLAELLVAYGYEACFAYDARSAIDLGETFHPDMALVDIGLPGADGYELARQFQRHPVLSHTRLIALTGHGQDQDRRQSADAGFRGHLVKPVDVDQLKAMLNRVGRERHHTA